MRPAGLTVLVTALVMSGVAAAQRAGAFGEARDHPAIDYTRRAEDTAVTALNARLAAGDATLPFEPVRGHLLAVLEALSIPVESQVLVFSETSFHARLISPANRAPCISATTRRSSGFTARQFSRWRQDPEQGTIFSLHTVTSWR